MKKKPNASGSGGRSERARAENHSDASPQRSLVMLWLIAALILGLGIISAMNWLKTKPTPPTTLDPSRPLSFNKDIAPIIFENCSTCHHPGESAPFNLLNYADVKKHARQIVEVTRRRIMPPWLPERLRSYSQSRLAPAWLRS